MIQRPLENIHRAILGGIKASFHLITLCLVKVMLVGSADLVLLFGGTWSSILAAPPYPFRAGPGRIYELYVCSRHVFWSVSQLQDWFPTVLLPVQQARVAAYVKLRCAHPALRFSIIITTIDCYKPISCKIMAVMTVRKNFVAFSYSY
jgi:hypothetical protein